MGVMDVFSKFINFKITIAGAVIINFVSGGKII